MEIAKLVLEYFKVLIWPSITIFFLIKYQNLISEVVGSLTAKLKGADKVTMKLAGQSIEISNAAKEVVQQRLKEAQGELKLGDSNAIKKIANDVVEIFEDFSDPLTELVGVFLAVREGESFSIPEIARAVFWGLAEEKNFTGKPPWIQKRFLGMIKDLVKLSLVSPDGEKYQITKKGAQVFSSKKFLHVEPNFAQRVSMFS